MHLLIVDVSAPLIGAITSLGVVLLGAGVTDGAVAGSLLLLLGALVGGWTTGRLLAGGAGAGLVGGAMSAAWLAVMVAVAAVTEVHDRFVLLDRVRLGPGIVGPSITDSPATVVVALVVMAGVAAAAGAVGGDGTDPARWWTPSHPGGSSGEAPVSGTGGTDISARENRVQEDHPE